MIAGLLGEHLASPRTALKTNQNTALEPKPAQRDESSSKEDFASYVADDPSQKEAPRAPSEADTRDSSATTDQLEPGLSPPGNSPHTIADDSSQKTAQPAQSAATVLDISRTPDAQEALSSEARASRIESNSEAETKPHPAPLSTTAPVETAVAGTSQEAALANSPEIEPTTATQLDAEKQTSNLVGDTRQTDPRARGEALLDTGPSDQNIKFNEGSAIESALSENDLKRLLSQTADGESSSRPATAQTEADIDIGRLGTSVDIVEGDLARINMPDETAEVQLRAAATTAQPATGGDLAAIVRDGAATGPDVTLNVGAITAPSTPTVAPTPGMIPVAPAIPIASPNDLTAVVMNAIQNGADPQEQLIVQLDPPELGRIMIDFKFDAQGLQQITVTSENPEALKRLREMHAELTSALQDQGLSGDNLSFQQDSQDRPQSNWGAQARSENELIFAAAEDQRRTPSSGPQEPGSVNRTRLDLVL